jgi:hypothetical protein
VIVDTRCAGPCLEAFHHQKLELDGKGSYTVGALKLSEDRPSSPTISTSSAGDSMHGAPPPRAHTTAYRPIEAPVQPPPNDLLGIFQKLARLLRDASPTGMWPKLLGVAGLVVFRVYLSDRMAHITGNNLRALLQRDLSGFLQLQLMSLSQVRVSHGLASWFVCEYARGTDVGVTLLAVCGAGHRRTRSRIHGPFFGCRLERGAVETSVQEVLPSEGVLQGTVYLLSNIMPSHPLSPNLLSCAQSL